MTYVGFAAYLFKGTVRDNLLMGNPNATDAQLWDALEKTQLADFVRSQGGLDMRVAERGGTYAKLFETQKALEDEAKGAGE